MEVFSSYPNVINEFIDLNLPNDGRIDDSEFMLPYQFEMQFSTGVTKIIDDAIIVNRFSFRFQMRLWQYKLIAQTM